MKQGIKSLFKKSSSVKSVYKLSTTAGVSAQGSGAPPILEPIIILTRRGMVGKSYSIVI